MIETTCPWGIPGLTIFKDGLKNITTKLAALRISFGKKKKKRKEKKELKHLITNVFMPSRIFSSSD